MTRKIFEISHTTALEIKSLFVEWYYKKNSIQMGYLAISMILSGILEKNQ